MKLSLLVVNYNTEKFIIDLLYSLTSQTLPKSQFEIIIINNCQNDYLYSLLQEHNFEQIFNLHYYDSIKNVGFGKAVNMMADHANGEHLLCINPDVLMKQDNYLEALLQMADDYPNYGVISTKVLNDKGQDVSTYYTYEFHETLGKEGICWFQGSLLLIRAEIFKEVGGFDPRFFMYCEDVDLCLQISKLGLSLLKNDDIYVYHYGGSSEPNRDINYYKRYMSSKLLFIQKNYPKKLSKEIIDDLYNKSRRKVIFYGITTIFIKRHHRHLAKQKAIKEIFNPNNIKTSVGS